MEERFNYQKYNWLYYVIGLVCGALTGLVVNCHVITGAVLGVLTGGLFQFMINKSRNEQQA